MLPAVVAHEIRHGLDDFLKTSFQLSSPYFAGLLDEFIENGTPFRGPYVSLGLPFLEGEHGRDVFPELKLRFPPYKHQEKAFARLSGEEPESTLIATGTGSGKTECFLYPILEHCRKNAGHPGVKAILIYPMNALATDQAGRIARMISGTPALVGQVRAGLYVGQQEENPAKTMGEDHVITDKATLRQNPPDILLTNYKMLDYLLVRHQDRPLWEHNGPETLRYLVVDELHTFDGAQGTDLACLIRRLKARLATPEHGLCCIGTSATLGTGSAEPLLSYAQDIFGEAFERSAVIEEERVSAAEFLGGGLIEYAMHPALEKKDELNPEHFHSPLEYIAAQVELWFGLEPSGDEIQSDAFRVELGSLLKKHLFFQNLVRGLGGEIRDVEELRELVLSFAHTLRKAPGDYVEDILLSLLSLVSHARREVTPLGEKSETLVMPLMNVRVQMWLREMANMVVSVKRRDEMLKSQPTLRFAADLPEQSEMRYLPLVYCRECGAAGWIALTDLQNKQYHTGLKPLYKAFFRPGKLGKEYRMFFPDFAESKEDAEATHKALPHVDGSILYMCGDCRALGLSTSEGCCSSCHSSNVIRVFVPHESSKECPICRAKNSMLLMGSRAATLTSALISMLYGSHYNDDKKLITFSDNVQDAAHRAGFFGARTYGVTLRTAIQQCLQSLGSTPNLAEFPQLFTEYWEKRLGRNVQRFVANFIHPSMEWRYDYDRLMKQGHLAKGSELLNFVEKRLSWEIWSEFTMSSRIGRTLEKTQASVPMLRPEAVDGVLPALTLRLQNEVERLRDVHSEDVRRFLLGLASHMRHNGSVFRDTRGFDSYIESRGDEKRISGFIYPWMPYLSTRNKLPKLLTSYAGARNFEQVVSLGKSSWCIDWALKAFPDLLGLGNSLIGTLYDVCFEELEKAGIVIRRELPVAGSKPRVWMLNPQEILLTTRPVRIKCSHCGSELTVPAGVQESWNGAPCQRYGCKGQYAVSKTCSEDYFGRLYCEGDLQRLYTAEHTGLLTRDERESIETAFRAGNDVQPDAPNLLSCTPTLEMGIDIGNLSSTIQCSVPPSQASYLQRVGRAGRKDGNALNLTIAGAKAHDLYFFEQPQLMMCGDVQTPGVFLNASAVLERQLTAFCLDRWVLTGITEKDIPAKLVSALTAYEKRNELAFPYNFLRYVENNATELYADFVALFEGQLTSDSEDYLKHFILGTLEDIDEGSVQSSLGFRILEGLGRVYKERNSLRDRASRTSQMLKRIEKNPAKGEKTDVRMDELKQEITALRKLASQIGQKNVFNFLTDEGLIPNYAFPEQGVTLHSIVYRKKEQANKDGDSQKEFDVSSFEYERAAQSAITEFALGNKFYAGKRQVVIDQVDIGTSKLEAWRLCPECSYTERVTSEKTGPCPRCGCELFADSGQRRDMLKMSQVFATTAERKSRVVDDSESRTPNFYVRQLLVDYDPADVSAAWKIDSSETAFGYAFLSRANFREINFGEYADEEDGLFVAGDDKPKQGFRICEQCGRLLEKKEKRELHAWGCPARDSKNKEKVLDCVYLYRDFQSEAIKVLLPFTGAEHSSVDMESFIAAFNLGLKLHFGGQISHLKSTLHTEPDEQEGKLRKHYLVIYDSVPGGTGYLKEIVQDKLIIEILEKALRHMQQCPCSEKPERDGCYRCLLAYGNSSQMRSISKTSAMRVLSGILKHQDALVETSELRSVSLGALFESQLELRFIEALRRQNSPERKVVLQRQVIHGREGFFLEFGETCWNIEQQVELGDTEGVSVPCRADFVLSLARSDGRAKPLVVFTDGFRWHKERLGVDMQQRMALLRSGAYHVWSLSYDDVEHVFGGKVRNAPDYVHLSGGLGWKTDMWSSYEPKLSNDDLLDEKSSFKMLCEILEHPDDARWKVLAEKYIQCSMTTPKVDSLAADVCQFFPTNLMDCAVLGGAKFAGHFSADGIEVVSSWRRGESTENAINDFSVALYLDDKPELRESQPFHSAWQGYLRAANVFQFCTRSAMVVQSGLMDGLFDDFAELTPEPRSGDLSEELGWKEVFELIDDAYEPLARDVQSQGCRAPEVGIELVDNECVIGEIELAWPDQKVGVLSQEYAGVLSRGETLGWKLVVADDRDKCLKFIEREVG
ncbi:DEAD/DEAH box helicase [Desulfobaculum bizertense]|uniref:DEAD/DEAH box helicase domain-containing protein n=1 Tax=Desulfobaculum bizertense DSM 18034 TaxID=1121442 RepID=A0A1T4VSZ0_9BACT|nr:DEAD/DEAH box helicase [Desulfobaculum bizertense]SKA67968.1 DEAD/DEAH box helicase domain-containing protein [Desulfobaculum bizertense DSM 18034]